MDAESLSDTSNEPTYNLKAVVRETGLKADTLRAWERRYGLPDPQRTPSGHRLYSARDIASLKWLISRQNEGLNISRAVALWQRLLEEGIDPIDESELSVIQSSVATSPHTPPILAVPAVIDTSIIGSGHIQELRQQWINYCLSFNEIAAEELLQLAFSLFSLEVVCVELLFKGIAEIGAGWSQGRVTAQQEHFASSLAIRRLHALHSGTPPPTKRQRIMIACPPDEEHVFASMLLSLLMRRRGWNVIYLGANVPPDNLANTLSIVKPDLVILTAQQLHTAGTLLELSHILYEHGIPLAYGGAIFLRSGDLQRCIPGHYLGDSISGATQIIEQIMSSPRVKSAPQGVPPEHIAGLRSFRENRAKIEKYVFNQMTHTNIARRTLDEANSYLGRNITASLSLCKNGNLESELEGIGMLLVNQYHMNSDAVDEYLHNYYQAAQQYLGNDGSVVLTWLHTLFSSELSFQL